MTTVAESTKACEINSLIDPVVWDRIEYCQQIRKAVLYLQDHLEDRISESAVAAVAGLEKTAFSKCFRNKIGLTFREFVEAVRISRAIEHMLKSDQSLTEIASVVGFASLTNFERAFQKRLGVSPSAYRKTLLRQKGLLPEIAKQSESASIGSAYITPIE